MAIHRASSRLRDKGTPHGARHVWTGVLRGLAFAAWAVLLGPAAIATASFLGRNGVVAYQSEIEMCGLVATSVSCAGGIWAVDPATGAERQLTAGEDSWPSFSPDGSQLAFHRYTQPSSTIYLAGADGSNARPLLRGSEPSFSPNGRELVFARSNGLYIAEIARPKRRRRITRYRGAEVPSGVPRERSCFSAPNRSAPARVDFQSAACWRSSIRPRCTCVPSSRQTLRW